MVMRVSITTVPLWQIAVSLVLLIITDVVMIWGHYNDVVRASADKMAAAKQKAQDNYRWMTEQARAAIARTSGTRANSELWLKPSDRTIRELLEFSIARSDNTSSDKLLELVGGPAALTERMRALGLNRIEVRSNVRQFLKDRDAAHPNTGSASDLARLLARLQKGEVLRPAQLEVLTGLMGRAVTGLQRLRAGVPAGTPVGDKTGTGPSTINDVGVVTLPEGKGHLALAVLLNGSKLSV